MKKIIVAKEVNQQDQQNLTGGRKLSKAEASQIKLLLQQAENPALSALTIEKLRSFPGCNYYTDNEAEQVINSLQQIASICYDLFKDKKTQSIDNQYYVYLNRDSEVANPVIPLYSNNQKKTA